MSILYYMALLATTTGIFIILLFIYFGIGKIYRSLPKLDPIEAFIFYIAILLTVWGIDALIHLDQF